MCSSEIWYRWIQFLTDTLEMRACSHLERERKRQREREPERERDRDRKRDREGQRDRDKERKRVTKKMIGLQL